MIHDPNDPATRRALEVIASVVGKLPAEQRQEGLTGIAVVAICMIRGTYGQQFAYDFLRGAVEEVASPTGLKIQLEVTDAERPTH